VQSYRMWENFSNKNPDYKRPTTTRIVEPTRTANPIVSSSNKNENALEGVVLSPPPTLDFDYQQKWNQLYDDSKLIEKKNEVSALDETIEKKIQERDDKLFEVDDNAWLSEASRVGRRRRVNEHASLLIGNYEDKRKRFADEYNQGVEELKQRFGFAEKDYLNQKTAADQKTNDLFAFLSELDASTASALPVNYVEGIFKQKGLPDWTAVAWIEKQKKVVEAEEAAAKSKSEEDAFKLENAKADLVKTLAEIEQIGKLNPVDEARIKEIEADTTAQNLENAEKYGTQIPQSSSNGVSVSITGNGDEVAVSIPEGYLAECGRGVNDAFGVPSFMKNSFADKMSTVDQSIANPTAGMAFVIPVDGKYKANGHCGVVKKVHGDTFTSWETNADDDLKPTERVRKISDILNGGGFARNPNAAEQANEDATGVTQTQQQNLHDAGFVVDKNTSYADLSQIEKIIARNNIKTDNGFNFIFDEMLNYFTETTNKTKEDAEIAVALLKQVGFNEVEIADFFKELDDLDVMEFDYEDGKVVEQNWLAKKL
jgi:hypothetical protein